MCIALGNIGQYRIGGFRASSTSMEPAHLDRNSPGHQSRSRAHFLSDVPGRAGPPRVAQGMSLDCVWRCQPSCYAGSRFFREATGYKVFHQNLQQLGDVLVLTFLPACAFAQLRLFQRAFTMSTGRHVSARLLQRHRPDKGRSALFSYSAVRGHFIRGLLITICGLAAVYGILSLFWTITSSISSTCSNRSWTQARSWAAASSIAFLASLVHCECLASGTVGLAWGLAEILSTLIAFSMQVRQPQSEWRRGHLPRSHLCRQECSCTAVSSVTSFTSWRGGSWRVITPQRHPAKLMIPTVFAASLFNLGPLFLPYVWLWLAFGAASDTKPRSLRIAGSDSPLHKSADIGISTI